MTLILLSHWGSWRATGAVRLEVATKGKGTVKQQTPGKLETKRPDPQCYHCSLLAGLHRTDLSFPVSQEGRAHANIPAGSLGGQSDLKNEKVCEHHEKVV